MINHKSGKHAVNPRGKNKTDFFRKNPYIGKFKLRNKIKLNYYENIAKILNQSTDKWSSC